MNEYNGNWRLFAGKLLTLESINNFPDCLEKEHFLRIRQMLKEEGFNPDDYRIGELPTEGVYYFEKAVQECGVDYFSVHVDKDQELIPQYTTLEYDENGFNTFNCKTIRESIDLHEC